MPREARWLALGHELRITAGRPFVQLKLALDARGMVPAGDGAPVWATGEAARARGHLLRAEADAILVGRGTVMADDPDLTCRLPGLEHRSPVRVVLSAQCGASRERQDAAQSGPGAGLGGSRRGRSGREFIAGSPRSGAECLAAARAAEGAGLGGGCRRRALAERGITRLLVEGGPSVAASVPQGRPGRRGRDFPERQAGQRAPASSRSAWRPCPKGTAFGSSSKPPSAPT